jgi:hypothetical protein
VYRERGGITLPFTEVSGPLHGPGRFSSPLDKTSPNAVGMSENIFKFHELYLKVHLFIITLNFDATLKSYDVL